MGLNRAVVAASLLLLAYGPTVHAGTTVALEGHQRIISGRPVATEIVNFNLVRSEKFRSDPVATVGVRVNYNNTLHVYKEQVAGRNRLELDDYTSANAGDYQTAFDVLSFGLSGETLRVDYTDWSFLARDRNGLHFLRQEYLFLGGSPKGQSNDLEQLKKNEFQINFGLYAVKLTQQDVNESGNLIAGKNLQSGYGAMLHLDNKLVPLSRFKLPVERSGVLIDDLRLIYQGAGSLNGRVAVGFAGYGDNYYWKLKRGIDFLMRRESYSGQGEDPKSAYSRVDYVTLAVGAYF